MPSPQKDGMREGWTLMIRPLYFLQNSALKIFR